MILLAPLADIRPSEVEALLDAAFGTDRHGRTAYRLREGVRAIPALSFAALEEGRLIGSLQSWPIELVPITGQPCPLVLVGPVAVCPDRQRDGVGRMLMQRLVEAVPSARLAGETGAGALAMIGDPEYYGRFFGFTADATGGWEVPGPVERRRLLARIAEGYIVPAIGVLRPRASLDAAA